MTNEQNVAISKRLDAIIAIMLNSTRIQEASLKERISILIQLGFDNHEIANILGTSSGLVAKERSVLKKGDKK